MARYNARRALRNAQEGRLLSDYVYAATRTRARARAAHRMEGLDGGERLAIIDTLQRVLGGAYCHLPQKKAAYARDPVQALELLRERAGDLSEADFHLQVTSIVTGLRDAHTRYSGPRRLQGLVAVLPFLVEQYGPFDAPVFVVSKVSAPRLIDDNEFAAGAILDSWNGIPFARAVDIYADRESGGRPDARRAFALESLTFRALEFEPPPDEMWVILGYRSSVGAPAREVRIPWRVVAPGRAPNAIQPGSRAARWKAANPSAELVRRAKKLMFSGGLWLAEADRRTVARSEGWIPTSMQDVLAARAVRVRGHGEFGYLRVWSFDVGNDDAFIAEVQRLLDLLPDSGLILDLRGNPGGLIWAAERMLQLFTPWPITPTRFALVATDLTRAMAASPFNRLELEAWLPSLDQAIETGEPYSKPLPLTDPQWCNDIGQHYGGPVVCVADSTTYSSGDLFSAGFVDNSIGPFVCVGVATGAGGANVWTHDDLRAALEETDFAVPKLPDGVGYTLAIRRAIRSGPADGVPIEDLGVAGVPYAMTRHDLLKSNDDLLAFCAAQLAGLPRTAMSVLKVDADSVRVSTRGLDQLETYVDGSPVEATRRITDGEHELPLLAGTTLDVVGRQEGVVCQRRRVALRKHA